MIQFVVLHRSQSRPWSWLEHHPEWAPWGTCLRQIAIGFGHLEIPALEDHDEVYTDMAAYRFLLEVICGLHSPVVGETEVFGQFKRFFDQIRQNENAPRALLSWLRQLMTDAKVIRHRHLTGLGSQSYGSLVRREVSPKSPVHILGGGQLAQEILPWLGKNKAQVTLHVRTPQKTTQSQGAQILSLNEIVPITGVLVVAAPVSARELEVWLDQRSVALEKIIDLRGEGRFDPLNPRAPVLDLAEAMQRLSKYRTEQLEIIDRARQEILLHAQAFASSAKVRPLGWDDLCA